MKTTKTQLEARVKQLESQILKYQVRLNERRKPSKKTSMAEYVFGFSQAEIWKNHLNEPFIVTGATLGEPYVQKSRFSSLLGYNIKLTFSFTVGNSNYSKEFRVPIIGRDSKKREESFMNELTPLVGKEQDFIVLSYRRTMASRKVHLFLEGYVDQGKEVFLKDIVERNLYKQREQKKVNESLQQANI